MATPNGLRPMVGTVARIGTIASMSKLPTTPMKLRKRLERLKKQRRARNQSIRATRANRRAHSATDRKDIGRKSGWRCHICGRKVDIRNWVADHVLPHAAGGKHDLRNYLPAHPECNRDRWHWSAEEYRLILKFGLWMRNKIDGPSKFGRLLAEEFTKRKRFKPR